MRNLVKEALTRLKALNLGLIPHDEENGIYYYKIFDGADEVQTLAKMSEFESNGFYYQGISNMVGADSYMVFSCTPQAASLK